MVNGECSTGQVVLWLDKHPKHTAEAPETEGNFETRVEVNFRHLVFYFRSGADWEVDEAPDLRSDWTLRDERGEPVDSRRLGR